MRTFSCQKLLINVEVKTRCCYSGESLKRSVWLSTIPIFCYLSSNDFKRFLNMKDLENQLVKHVTNTDGNTEMFCEACNCLPISRHAVQGALPAQWRLREEKGLLWKTALWILNAQVETAWGWEQFRKADILGWRSVKKQVELLSGLTFLKCQCPPHQDQSKPKHNPIWKFCLSLLSLYVCFEMPHLTQPAVFKGTNSKRCHKGRICAVPLLL